MGSHPIGLWRGERKSRDRRQVQLWKTPGNLGAFANLAEDEGLAYTQHGNELARPGAFATFALLGHVSSSMGKP